MIMNVFEQQRGRFIEFLNKHHIWVLATCSDNDISARNMSVISIGHKIYFQTDITFEKYKHIVNNPHVALCCENYQVKGTAKILGATADKKNAEIMNKYQRVHPSSYKHYSGRDNSCLIEINPESLKMWDYINSEPYITKVNFMNENVECYKYE